jgi:hypothetical protein
LLLASPAFAGRATISGAEASSTYSGEGNYGASRVHDGKQGTSWVEGDEGSGLGATVTLQLEGSLTVTGVRIWGGDWYNSDAWDRANRPKDLELLFADGHKQTVTLEDKMQAQTFTLDKPAVSDNVRVRIKSVYGGSTWLDTGISEVQVLTKEAGKHLDATVSSSTALPADADGNYESLNVTDGIVDSMWCEADKEGDGTGQTLSFDFGGDRKVSKLHLINGMGTSLSLWMKANRGKTAQISFSDGSTADVELKNSVRMQTVEFSGRSVSSAKITFTEVTAGKEYNDLCISEAYFSE